MNSPSRLLILCFCLALFQSFGQQVQDSIQQVQAPVSSIHLTYGLGAEARNTKLVPVRELDSNLESYPQDFAPVSHSFSLGYNFKPGRFWALGADLAYVRLNREHIYNNFGHVMEADTSRTLSALIIYGYNIFGINLYAEGDLLWNLSDDAFLLSIGLNTAYVERFDSREEYFKDNGEIYNTLVRKRFGVWLRPYFSLSWEEYLGQHFGYRLGATYYPEFHFTPYKLVVTEDIREGEEFPNQVYSYSDSPEGINELPREKIDQRALYLNVSLLYRL